MTAEESGADLIQQKANRSAEAVRKGIAAVEAERLRAAGHRRQPEPREVTTVEELDALPVGSVIRTEEGRVAVLKEKWSARLGNNRFLSQWLEAGEEFYVGSDELDDLPARILFPPRNEAAALTSVEDQMYVKRMGAERDARQAIADERDTALAALEEAERNNADLLITLTELKPAEVLVEGSYFAVGDLPAILGNFMRSDIEWSREMKRAHLREEGLAAERDAAERDWADYFESFDSTAGAPALTPALAASMLRGPRPWGTASGVAP